MATYVKTGDTSSAKTVFDYLAHRRVPQQQQQQQKPSSSPVESWTRPGDDDLDDAEQSDVDVVDFNLLMRTVGQEEQHKAQHDNRSNVPNQILDILRHMALVGVTSNATTLRTLLDIYPSDDIKMEDQLFMTLRNDPQATHHDRIWLNNLKLTRFLLDNNDKDGRGSLKAATIFLSNDRSSLFPECVGEPIEADGMTYKLLLDALTRHKRHAAMAQRIFDHMRSRGWRPTMMVYEQLMVVWAKRQQVEKVKAVIDVACQDLGWSQVPAKWYTSALDALVNQSSPHVHAWILEIKKQKAVLADPVLADRLVKYGLSSSPPMNKHKQQYCHS
jgi:pentatricopeptide repeat protein